MLAALARLVFRHRLLIVGLWLALTLFGAFVLFGGWYVLSARKWFKGPIRQGDEAELERIEREFGEAGTPAAAPAS